MYRSQTYTSTIENFSVSEDLVCSSLEDSLLVESMPDNVGIGVVDGSDLCLERGNYVFAIDYNTDSSSNIIQLVSDTDMDKEGNVGTIYAESELIPQQEKIRFEVELEQDVTNFHVRFLILEGSLKISNIVY